MTDITPAGLLASGQRPVDRFVHRLTQALLRYQVPLSSAFLSLWIVVEAIRKNGDACYDMANYHIYGPFALLHDKLGRDLAPAQSQSYLPPLLDVPYYLLSRHIPSVGLLNALLAIPEAAALSLLFLITLRLADVKTVNARLTALVAVLFSATGAATYSVLATSMSDMIPCSLMLAGVWALISREDDGRRLDWRAALAAGLLVGTALGLKLTLSYAAAGFVVGLLAWRGLPAVARVRLAAVFGLGAGLAMVVVVGWWWWRLYAFSGNPMFPIYNDLFQSPLARIEPFVDTRFFPRTLHQRLLYPFLWMLHATPLVTEPDQPMRDPRIALGLVAAAGLLLLGLRRRHATTGRVCFLAVLYIVGYALWQRQFSIFRYLSFLELLTGPMLALLALSVLRGTAGHQAALNGALITLFVTMSFTIMPQWGRLARPNGRPLAVWMPRLPEDSLVLLADASPLAFLAAYQPQQVRFFGIANNLVQPTVRTALSDRMRREIAVQLREHPDHLWSIDRPDHRFGNADDALAGYALHRGICRTIGANIVYEPIRLCQLVR